jgi:hypothetical protein
MCSVWGHSVGKDEEAVVLYFFGRFFIQKFASTEKIPIFALAFDKK